MLLYPCSAKKVLAHFSLKKLVAHGHDQLQQERKTPHREDRPRCLGRQWTYYLFSSPSNRRSLQRTQEPSKTRCSRRRYPSSLDVRLALCWCQHRAAVARCNPATDVGRGLETDALHRTTRSCSENLSSRMRTQLARWTTRHIGFVLREGIDGGSRLPAGRRSCGAQGRAGVIRDPKVGGPHRPARCRNSDRQGADYYTEGGTCFFRAASIDRLRAEAPKIKPWIINLLLSRSWRARAVFTSQEHARPMRTPTRGRRSSSDGRRRIKKTGTAAGIATLIAHGRGERGNGKRNSDRHRYVLITQLHLLQPRF